MKEIGLIFLRLGCLGFGGPVAVIAMMEEETSRKRGWVTAERFAEMMAVCKVLPGPVSTQMAIYLGYLRGGVAGGILSGTLFILPAFVLILVLSSLYVNHTTSMETASLFKGVQTAALVIIIHSTIQLGRPYAHQRVAWLIGLSSAAFTLFEPRWEVLVILFWGLAGSFRAGSSSPGQSRTPTSRLRSFFLPSLAWASPSVLPALAFMKSRLFQLFWMSFKSGAFVFGTGLAIVPLLESDAVQRYGWLTHEEFMDGVAMGQLTPGPFVITATFIGYKAAGTLGAIVATIGMFLPGFINILFVVPRLWGRISKTPYARGFTAWAIPAVVGGILGTACRLGWSTLDSTALIALFGATMALTLRYPLPAWILLPAAGAIHFIYLTFVS